MAKYQKIARFHPYMAIVSSSQTGALNYIVRYNQLIKMTYTLSKHMVGFLQVFLSNVCRYE